LSQENPAGTTARASAELQNSLAGISLPAIKEALAGYMSDLGQPGQEPASIKKAYGDVRAGLASDYESNRASSSAYLKQQALQSGTNYTPSAMTEASTMLSNQLSDSEHQQIRALNFQEAQAGMNQTNSLLSNITGTSGNILSGALRFGGNALQSDTLLQQYQQMQRQQNSQYGSLAGTIVGGAIGAYVGGPGGATLGAGLGSAGGGLIGGLWGSG